MEMRFDPMTGEPINPQPQENGAQETGTNTQEQTADAAQSANAGTQDVSAGTQGVNPDFSNYITKNFLLIFCAITIWSSRQGESLNEQKENNIIDHYSCI